MFWVTVGLVYLALLVVGLRLGWWLAKRRPNGGSLVVLPTPSDDPLSGLSIPDFVPHEWVTEHQT